MGVGNPNVEFAPNISTCALASDGANAMVLWGKRNGEVTISIANKAIDLSRRGVNFLLSRCSIDDEHDGPVLDAVWDGNRFAITSGGDGRLKLWNAQSVRCLWTSEQQRSDLVIDPFVKVASAVTTKGFIVGCTRSGNITLFNGFAGLITPNVKLGRDQDDVKTDDVHTVSIPCPFGSSTDSRTIASLHIDSYASRTEPTLLAAYENDVHFYKIALIFDDTGKLPYRIDTFGDHLFGPLSCVRPIFAHKPDQSSFVLTGDRMGGIGVYEWQGGNDSLARGVIRPVQRFEAHGDGSTITAIHWDGTTLITGSSRGTTHVFDGLMFRELRSFASPTPKFRGRGHAPPVDPNDDGRVRQILVSPDRDVMIASVGNAVLTWKAGSISKNVGGGVRGRMPIDGSIHRKKKAPGGKWLRKFVTLRHIINFAHIYSTSGTEAKYRRLATLVGAAEETPKGL
jgi:WD40 repeat protein